MDTETKKMEVSVDGKSLANIREIHFDCGYGTDNDEGSCSMHQYEDMGDMRKYTTLMACEFGEGKNMVKMGYEKTFGGLICVPSKSPVQNEISKLFEKI